MARKINRRNRRRNRRAPGLATVPRMMGRMTYLKRKAGVDTKVFWFKTNAVVRTTPSANQFLGLRTFDLSGPTGPQSFSVLCNLYDQYKILGMKVKYFPANLGTEADPIAGQFQTPLKRGNVVCWIDQRYDPGTQTPSTISEVIGNNNTRMLQPNRRITCSIWRPIGKVVWGSTKDLQTAGDPWSGELALLINDASITPPNGVPIVLYYYTVQYKVVFRGRVDD